MRVTRAAFVLGRTSRQACLGTIPKGEPAWHRLRSSLGLTNPCGICPGGQAAGFGAGCFRDRSARRAHEADVRRWGTKTHQPCVGRGHRGFRGTARVHRSSPSGGAAQVKCPAGTGAAAGLHRFGFERPGDLASVGGTRDDRAVARRGLLEGLERASRCRARRIPPSAPEFPRSGVVGSREA